MMRNVLVPLMVIGFFCLQAHAEPNDKEDNGLSPTFAKMSHELGAVCGPFLPNQIPGITELMSLCGARIGTRVGPHTMMEGQFLTGAARAQRYMLASLSFRGDVQIDDLVGSYYAGPDLHYATSPIFATGFPASEETNLYWGAHVGGAVWWEFSENFYFRGDLQFNFNPGTSLFVGFGLELRFDPKDPNEQNNDQNQQQQ